MDIEIMPDAVRRIGAREVLRVENLHKSFGAIDVLRGIDLTVMEGETVVLLGASGSGKSTLLRCINFLEYPTDGRVAIDGKLIGTPKDGSIVYSERSLCDVRAHVGMVFQQFNLFPHLTVEENVMLGPMKIRGKSRSDAQELAQFNLKRVGIAEKSKQYPSRLSGGQQQRVAIARALAMEPAVILFDECTSALDPELVGEVLLVMRQLEAFPTHVFIQGGVGGLAASVCSYLWERFDEKSPSMFVVEPDKAPCILLTAEAGRPTRARGNLDTIMAGLACGEVSLLAWSILESGVDGFLSISDEAAAETMRLLANAPFRDAPIVAGESAVPGLTGLLLASQNADARRQLRLDRESVVFLIGTEGATDPKLYESIVGQSPEQVFGLAETASNSRKVS